MSLVPASQEEVQSLQQVISQSPTVAPQETWLTSQGSVINLDEIHAFLEVSGVVVGGSLPGLVLKEEALEILPSAPVPPPGWAAQSCSAVPAGQPEVLFLGRPLFFSEVA